MLALSPWTNQPLELFHGTVERYIGDIQQNGFDPSRGKWRSDFGPAFYTTTREAQAAEWARRMADKRGGRPGLIGITVNRLALSKLPHLDFRKGDQQDVDFWSFVTHCRERPGVNPITGDYYGVVYGPVSRRFRNMTLWPGLDQVSFHGSRGREFLNNPEVTTIRVLKMPARGSIDFAKVFG